MTSDRSKISVSTQAGSRIPHSSSLQLKVSGIRKDERFEKMRLGSISFTECEMTNCVFSDLHSTSVSLGGGNKQSHYRNCVFEECDFQFFAVGNVRLTCCRFLRCRLNNMFAPNLEAISCSFIDTKIHKAVFHGKTVEVTPGYPKRERNEFVSNDFSSAELIDVGFRGGIDLLTQQWPTSNQYILVRNTTQAARQVGALEKGERNPAVAKRLVVLQRLLLFYSETGQTTQLIDLNGWNEMADILRQQLSIIT